jgi:hypothetical protein
MLFDVSGAILLSLTTEVQAVMISC